jgi:PhnB protein
MKTVTSYLTLNGNCRQAMTFYQQCLGTELQLTPWPDAQGKPSTDPSAGIMHARMSRGGAPILMASDTQPGDSLQVGNNFSVAIDCDSPGEAERVFTALGAGGKVRLPFGKMPWGASLGMLTDQFGIQWMVSCD